MHRQAGSMTYFLQCLFHGRLNFVMSPALFCIKPQLFSGQCHFISLIHFISLTAACKVKMCFKIEVILYGMQRQPGQPFLVQPFLWSAYVTALANCQAPIVISGTMLCHSERIVQACTSLGCDSSRQNVNGILQNVCKRLRWFSVSSRESQDVALVSLEF